MSPPKTSVVTDSANVAPIQRIRAGLRELQMRQQAEQRTALQMKLFPNWPDDRRGAPCQVVRSSIFGVVKRGRKKRVVDLPVATNDSATMTLTGWLLDQDDLDVWLEVHHLARSLKPGDEVRFTIYAMVKCLHKTIDGESYHRLKRRLKHLMETTLTYDTPGSYGGTGSLILSFNIDKLTGEAVVRTNPEMRGLWESVAWLDVEERRSLNSQIAKALHAMLAALPEWPPIRLDNLMARIGAHYSRLRDFRADLKVVLDDFQRRGWIRSFAIAKGDRGLVEIDKVPTPSQARAIEARSSRA